MYLSWVSLYVENVEDNSKDKLPVKPNTIKPESITDNEKRRIRNIDISQNNPRN
ncbi:MAG: hypothetical protein ACQERZ_05320 [Fusobacteriota bacterium]